MGQTFSYDIWVPHERLYQAAVAIAKREPTPEFRSRVWPDGRPISPEGEADKAEDFPFGVFYDLRFRFEPDDVLREYNEREIEHVRDYNAEIRAEYRKSLLLSFWGRAWHRLLGRAPAPDAAELPAQLQDKLGDETYANCERENGTIELYSIDTAFVEFPDGREWLDGEADLARIRFEGCNSAVSYAMIFSDSVCQFFVELAREVGAWACVVKGRLVFFDGEECDASYGEDEVGSPFGLAAIAGRAPSENARRMNELALSGQTDLDSERGRALLKAARDPNSGIRARALSALYETEDARAHEVIAVAFDDADARVRETAVYLYALGAERDIAPIVRLLRDDPSADVRLRAIESLRGFEAALPVLRELLLQTPVSDARAIRAALSSLRYSLHLPQSADILREALARPDLPYREWAQAQLVECAEIEVRLREYAASLNR